ncbi:hypothetical protein DFH07DRAFT_974863 [Mycena maculata]|uniref:DUF6532 domain-containing protein n=1 Tax=Mycena maculata TaxID=230809 RepID=A0AAD7H673_9AGAR|nr:hypothetical protein DFH07DRAFT_974863 [Mycena maculata]
MAGRSKRTQSTARPGKIIADSKQKRRSPDEKAADELAKEQAKAAKEKNTIEAHQASIRRVAEKEDAFRLEDEQAHAHSAHPDLFTAVANRSAADEIFEDSAHHGDVEMQGASEDEAPDGVMDEGSDADYNYQPGDEPSEDQADVDSETEAVQEFLRARAAAKKKGKKPVKAAKGTLRAEIQGAARVPIPVNGDKSLKRKPSDQAAQVQPKKSKIPAIGGLKKGWQKAVGVVASNSTNMKAVRGRAASVSTTATMHSVVSSRASSMASAKSGVTDDPIPTGEFNNEESQPSLQAARGAKTTNAMTVATAKMGISLVPKVVALNVDGKVQHKAKPKYTNSHLPFPADSYPADLKFWQTKYIPELIRWAGTHYDPFAANSHPEFRPVVLGMWTQYFTAYDITDAVYAVAAAAIRNWRSKIGKTPLHVVETIFENDEKYATIDARADYVRDKLQDSAFIYLDEENETGAYRSELILRAFAAHLDRVSRVDADYGHPVGALAITCAAVERALHKWKTGESLETGVKRKGKRSVSSFIAVPWAARAKAYLPPIKELTPRKWEKIIVMSSPYILSAAQITVNDTEGEESGGDSRGLINISDDSDDDEPEEVVEE